MGYRVYGEQEDRESPLSDFILGIFTSFFAFMNFGWIPVALGWADNRTMFLFFALLGFILGGRWAFVAWKRLKLSTKQEGNTHA